MDTQMVGGVVSGQNSDVRGLSGLRLRVESTRARNPDGPEWPGLSLCGEQGSHHPLQLGGEKPGKAAHPATAFSVYPPTDGWGLRTHLVGITERIQQYNSYWDKHF